jgi:hypothetical protein
MFGHRHPGSEKLTKSSHLIKKICRQLKASMDLVNYRISLSGMSGGDGQLAVNLPVRHPRLCGCHQHQLRHFPGETCGQSGFFQAGGTSS